MSDQSLNRQPHRYQPDDQFQSNAFPGTETPPQDQGSVAPTSQPYQPAPRPTTFEPAPGLTQSQVSQTSSNQPTGQPIPNLPPAEPVQPVAPPINSNNIQDEVFLEWDAPSRPHKKRKRQYYATIAIILILIGMILFFAGQFLPIAVLAAVGFLVYVLEMVPPTLVHHSISTYGFRVEGTLYFWNQLGRFWFDERYGHPLLQIETFRFPNRITVLIDGVSQIDLVELLSEVLINEQPPLTPLEKAANWLEKALPLEPDAPSTTTTPTQPPQTTSQPTPPTSNL